MRRKRLPAKAHRLRTKTIQKIALQEKIGAPSAQRAARAPAIPPSAGRLGPKTAPAKAAALVHTNAAAANVLVLATAAALSIANKPHNKASFLADKNLVDSLCGVAPMADAGLISTFHPGDKGFASYRCKDVNITFSGPRFSKGIARPTPTLNRECGGSPRNNRATRPDEDIVLRHRRSLLHISTTPCRP